MAAGYGAAMGFAVGVPVTMTAAFAHASGHPLAGLIPIGVTVAAVSVNTTVIGALLSAVQCWALYDSFLHGRAGVMVLDPAAAQAAVVLLLIAVVSTAAARGQPRQCATAPHRVPTSTNDVAVAPPFSGASQSDTPH